MRRGFIFLLLAFLVFGMTAKAYTFLDLMRKVEKR